MPSGISLTKVREITDEQIAQVRRFNRIVTQRVGALDEAFLARGRPLGQARVLWEVGPDGADVRALRARLGLDSGYLSRVGRRWPRTACSSSSRASATVVCALHA